jgi:type IV pilus assembly protein PilQ
MAEFTPRKNASLRTAKLAVTAAALFGLAGTPVTLAQTKTDAKPAAQPAQPATQPTSNYSPSVPGNQPAAQNQSRPGNGKLIRQAGSVPAAPKANTPGDAQPPADGAAQPEDDGKVKVDEHLIVDLHVNDEDLANVLQMLSIQSQKNIVTSKSVAAVVTANLYGVTFYEALDAILHVNGYGYIERGNFIYVYTLDELRTIEEANRSRVWKVVKLNYLNSTDAAEFVKPLLSEGGQIKTNGKAANFQISENAPGGAEDYAHDSTMMVFDYEENLAEIEKVVKEIDTRPSQVLVEATILQTSLNESNAFGVDFSVIADMSFADFVNVGGPLEVVNGLIKGNGSSSGTSGTGGGTGGTGGSSSGTPLPVGDQRGAALSSTPGNTAGPGTLKVGLVWNDVAAFIKMLDQVADTSIISRPNILTLNRQPARVLVGRKVGYLNSTTTDTATTQTVEFLDTGTQLYLRPFISSDGSIRMELKPKVSEAVIRNTTSQGGQTVTIPDEISNELTTNVIVRDGQTVVLGGLFRESTTSARRQVPGLGDIPLIGYAFRGHDDQTERNEVIFMITPTVLADAMASEQGRRGLDMVERVRAGSREGLMLWSREKRCQQLVMEATRLAQEGKRDEALAKVQRALSLSKNQADAIQLREELMNQKSNWPTRSMQHEIVKGELEKKLSGSKKAEADLKAAEIARREARRNPKRKPAPVPDIAIETPGHVVFTEELPEPVAQPEPMKPFEPAPTEPAPSEPGMNDPGSAEPTPEPASEPTEPKQGPGNDPDEGPQGPQAAKVSAGLNQFAAAPKATKVQPKTQPKAVSAVTR